MHAKESHTHTKANKLTTLYMQTLSLRSTSTWQANKIQRPLHFRQKQKSDETHTHHQSNLRVCSLFLRKIKKVQKFKNFEVSKS